MSRLHPTADRATTGPLSLLCLAAEPPPKPVEVSSEPSASPPEPLPVPPEPLPVPPEPAAPPPRSSASLPKPWGPLPETAEDAAEEALQAVRRLTQAYPQSADAFGLLGSTLYLYGNAVDAVKWWNKCLEADPDRDAEHRMLGVAASDRGEYEEAARLLRRAREINANLPNIDIYQAKVFLEMGKPQLAATMLEKTLETSPSPHEHHFLLGQAYSQLKQYEKAIENYEASAKLKPLNSAIYFGLANAHTRLGQRDEAAGYREKFKNLRAEEQRVLAERRKNEAYGSEKGIRILAKTHADTGLVYEAYRNLPMAQHHWQRAADVDPKNTTSRERLFNLHNKNRRWTEALEICRQLREIDPKNPLYHFNTGVLLARSRQLDAAEKAFGKVIEVAPDKPMGYRILTVFLLQRGKPDEAKATAQKLVQLQQTAKNYAILGQVCLKAGDSAGAIAAVKAAVRLDPDNERYKKFYDRLEAKQ